MIWALIPARGGSKRIPRKNLQEVGGISLVARAVRAALNSYMVDRVYVSTDDKGIAEEARRNLAYVVDRPAELASDDITMEPVLGHFIEAVKANSSDIVVILEPTAPLRTGHDIDAALILLRNAQADAVRLVAKVEATCHPITYRDAGLANAVRVGAFRKTDCLFPVATVLLHHGDDRSIDVDTPEDLERARAAVGV